jgi:signal transduction histidine kinase
LSTPIDWRWASRVRLTTLVVLGLVTLSAVALSGRSIARSITRPMQSLRSAANSLAGGDLGARAAADVGPAEVRDVAGACNAMADRLVHLVELQRAFVADASHQLRTPLTAIHIRLRQFRREMQDRPADCEALDAVSADIARFHRLVEGLLSLARLEAGPAEQTPTAVTPLLVQRRSTWAPLAEEGGVELVLKTGAGLAVLAHPDGLEQALDNLLANAVEVAPAGSTITLAAEAHGRAVDIHVVDHGPGLAPDQRLRAFDRFWKGRPDGTGLGLAVVRQVAVANGGTARLEESAGGGVDAVISLPGCPCPSPLELAERLHRAHDASPGQGG